MKKALKVCLAVVCGALLIYAAYLVYKKFIKDGGEEDDDLTDDKEEVRFCDRVKKAAEKQLAKIS